MEPMFCRGLQSRARQQAVHAAEFYFRHRRLMDQSQVDVRSIIRDTLEEFARIERTKAEPAYKAELTDERKRREQLEQRVNELIEENTRSRIRAEEVERASAIRSELQRLG